MQGSLPRPQRIIFAHLPHPFLRGQGKAWSPLLFRMFPLGSHSYTVHCSRTQSTPPWFPPCWVKPLSCHAHHFSFLQDPVQMCLHHATFPDTRLYQEKKMTRSNLFLFRIWIAPLVSLFLCWIDHLWHFYLSLQLSVPLARLEYLPEGSTYVLFISRTHLFTQVIRNMYEWILHFHDLPKYPFNFY